MQWDHRTRFRVLKTPNNRTRPEDRIPCGDLDKRAWWKRIPFKVTATNTANSFPSTCTHPRGAEVTKTPGRNSIYSLSHSLQGPARVLPPSPRSPRFPNPNHCTTCSVFAKCCNWQRGNLFCSGPSKSDLLSTGGNVGACAAHIACECHRRTKGVRTPLLVLCWASPSPMGET